MEQLFIQHVAKVGAIITANQHTKNHNFTTSTAKQLKEARDFAAGPVEKQLLRRVFETSIPKAI